MKTEAYSKLETILGSLNYIENVEGVVHPETIYEQILDPKVKIVQVIDGNLFNLRYSKSYKELKFVFGDVQEREIDSHIINCLDVIYKSLNDIGSLLDQLTINSKAS
ncbi:hypothetical protein NRS6186_22120 (plasmid) [Bacillus subtilis]|uniref:hypothetical protein n=1 Tax=Bacillus TaxID=1386 RepID=UPI0008B703E8|nr:hypothetical protein [Bacillus]KAA0930130.1 hypothetical protein FQ086_21525 [Bacillus sp. ANT_WA51]MDW4547515.1 hypothetical protein [Bacillus subtilis subsp. subtilis]TDO84573.1 hypothetical protein BDW29_4362 [Bacillus sp. AtDRG31]CAF1899959.1 hypothetical protein NRS6186_04047 [Bacillus subtilis]CAI6330362.1 hypothetical protein NRS6186_22120 [Bacillus subtilis]